MAAAVDGMTGMRGVGGVEPQQQPGGVGGVSPSLTKVVRLASAITSQEDAETFEGETHAYGGVSAGGAPAGWARQEGDASALHDSFDPSLASMWEQVRMRVCGWDDAWGDCNWLAVGGVAKISTKGGR